MLTNATGYKGKGETVLQPEESMLINLTVSELFHGVGRNTTCHLGSKPEMLSETFSQVCVHSLKRHNQYFHLRHLRKERIMLLQVTKRSEKVSV